MSPDGSQTLDTVSGWRRANELLCPVPLPLPVPPTGTGTGAGTGTGTGAGTGAGTGPVPALCVLNVLLPYSRHRPTTHLPFAAFGLAGSDARGCDVVRHPSIACDAARPMDGAAGALRPSANNEKREAAKDAYELRARQLEQRRGGDLLGSSDDESAFD